MKKLAKKNEKTVKLDLVVFLFCVDKERVMLYNECVIRWLYGRGGRESLSMRKVRATKKQGAGEIPVKATLRKVQQKTTAYL